MRSCFRPSNNQSHQSICNKRENQKDEHRRNIKLTLKIILIESAGMKNREHLHQNNTILKSVLMERTQKLGGNSLFNCKAQLGYEIGEKWCV